MGVSARLELSAADVTVPRAANNTQRRALRLGGVL